MWVQSQKMAKKAEKGILVGYEGSLIYYIWLPYIQRVIRLSLVTFIEDSLLFKPIIDIYIKIILSSHVIDGVDSELNNSKKSIPRIGSGDMMVSASGIKYYWGIKGSGIKIYILFST